MRRRLTNIVSVLSLLVLGVVVAAWVRSYWVSDFLWYGQIGAHVDRVCLTSEPGSIQLSADRDPTAPAGKDELHYSNWPASGSHWGGEFYMRVYWDRLGFMFITDRHDGFLRRWYFAVPHWFLAGMCAVFPARWAWRRCHGPRSVGMCAKCGYDLRASPERCPECGAPNDTAAPAAA